MAKQKMSEQERLQMWALRLTVEETEAHLAALKFAQRLRAIGAFGKIAGEVPKVKVARKKRQAASDSAATVPGTDPRD